MKHSLQITVILMIVFVFSQLIGLAIINQYIDYSKTSETGEVVLTPLPYGERPEIENQSTSFIHIFLAVILGTMIAFMFIRFRLFKLWKFWYWIAVTFCLTAAFGAFTPAFFSGDAAKYSAIVFAFFFATYKVLRPSIIIHNFTELFIYGGLVAIFIQILNIWSAFIILILISAYDAYAVWSSKHMQKLAKFQTKSKMFAGLYIPYQLPKKIPKGAKFKLKKVRTAILGGGDIGFPLFFTGAVLKSLAVTSTPIVAFLKTSIVTVFVSLALFLLLLKSEKGKFYPAMPFISAGCFLGYFVLLLLSPLL